MSLLEPLGSGHMLGAHSVDTLSSLLSLQVPTPTQQSLTFCEATPAALQGWMDSLPKANLGETARQLYQGLLETNRLQTPASNRLALLELFRTEIHTVCKNLERYFLDQPVALDQRAYKVASLCLSLQNHLATGYKQVLAHSSPRERQPLFAPALQRATRCLYAALVRSIQLYGPPPEGLWLELHQLYMIAMQEGVQHQAIRDRLARHTETLSIEQSYLAALLLGMARCNQMRRRNIGILGEILENWCSLANLQKGSALGSLFVIMSNVDAPPRHRSLVQPNESSGLIGIDTHPLTDALCDYLMPDPRNRRPVQLKAIDSLDKDTLQRLYLAWSEVAERAAKRVPGSGTLGLCLGMTAVHYHLAGQRSFNDLLTQTDAPRPAHFSPNASAADVWDQPYDSRTDPNPWIIGSEPIGYAPKDSTASSAPPAYPTYNTQVVNQSLGGYCLSWDNTPPEQLQVGELLGLKAPGNKGWLLAVVRWIYLITNQNTTQMGVQLLSPHATPCGLRLLHKEREGSQYLRALSLPENPLAETPPLLLVPLLPFQEGHKVRGLLEGQEFQALLTHRHSGTSSYNLFEYQQLELPKQEAPATASTTPATVQTPDSLPKEDDFDSLWKSL